MNQSENSFRRLDSHMRLVYWRFLFFVFALMGLAESGLVAAAQSTPSKDAATSSWGKPLDPNQAEPFWGEHQGGIVTKPQHFIYFAAFDLTSNNRDNVIKLLKAWTVASARMSEGETAQPLRAEAGGTASRVQRQRCIRNARSKHESG
jgi:hypothetical protein